MAEGCWEDTCWLGSVAKAACTKASSCCTHLDPTSQAVWSLERCITPNGGSLKLSCHAYALPACPAPTRVVGLAALPHGAAPRAPHRLVAVTDSGRLLRLRPGAPTVEKASDLQVGAKEEMGAADVQVGAERFPSISRQRACAASPPALPPPPTLHTETGHQGAGHGNLRQPAGSGMLRRRGPPLSRSLPGAGGGFAAAYRRKRCAGLHPER